MTLVRALLVWMYRALFNWGGFRASRADESVGGQVRAGLLVLALGYTGMFVLSEKDTRPLLVTGALIAYSIGLTAARMDRPLPVPEAVTLRSLKEGMREAARSCDRPTALAVALAGLSSGLLHQLAALPRSGLPLYGLAFGASLSFLIPTLREAGFPMSRLRITERDVISPLLWDSAATLTPVVMMAYLAVVLETSLDHYGWWLVPFGLVASLLLEVVAGQLIAFMLLPVHYLAKWFGVDGRETFSRGEASSFRSALVARLSLELILCMWLGYGVWALTFFSAKASLPSLFFFEGYPVAVALLFFLVRTRLFLWPLLAVTIRRAERRRSAVEQPRKSDSWRLPRCYFDRHIWMPLPGEADAIELAGETDLDAGIEAALQVAKTTNHLSAAMIALDRFEQRDPFAVHARVAALPEHAFERAVLLRHRMLRPSAALANVLRAIGHLNRLTVLNEAKEWPAEQARAAQGQAMDAGGAGTERGADIAWNSWRDARTLVGEALGQLSAARECGAKFRGLPSMLAFYARVLSALDLPNVAELSHFRWQKPSDGGRLFGDALEGVLLTLDESAGFLDGYVTGTTRVTRQAAILSASARLRRATARTAKLAEPHRSSILFVVRHWQRLVDEAVEVLADVMPDITIANPYVAGNPVSGSLFVGRDDIFKKLHELWRGDGARDSVVLHGHRRMGKTSILKQLSRCTDRHTSSVDFDMQRLGIVSNTGELLYSMALALHDATPGAVRQRIPEPREAEFAEGNPRIVFDRFIRRIDRIRGRERFIIAIDEFELIEDQIEDGTLDARLLEYFRGLIIGYPWITMAFAGRSTLKEMTENYWNPLYGQVKSIAVSFLDSADARRLITQPSDDFEVNFDEGVVDSIIELTHGQPYLIQLLCSSLLRRLNARLNEGRASRPLIVELDDFRHVLSGSDFLVEGSAYFHGIWQQAGTPRPPCQQAILVALAAKEQSMAAEELLKACNLSEEQFYEAVETLRRHDVVVYERGRVGYCVEFMRRWVSTRAQGAKPSV